MGYKLLQKLGLLLSVIFIFSTPSFAEHHEDNHYSEEGHSNQQVENKNGFDVFSIGSSVEQTLPVMYSEVIFENCLSFRVNAQEKIIDVMLRNEEADMLFKVYTGSK